MKRNGMEWNGITRGERITWEAKKREKNWTKRNSRRKKFKMNKKRIYNLNQNQIVLNESIAFV